MVKREIYSVGLKRKVEADVQEIIATPSRGGGFRYQVVGIFTDEDGKEHKCQSMIGKADAETVAASIGQSLPTTEAELKEAEVVESFAAEGDEVVAAEPELLVPEPSTSPMGDGRVLGQHTGGEIIAATDDSQSLPAHDYVFIGRAEEMSGDKLDQIVKEITEAQKRDAKENSGKRYITTVNEKYGSDAVRKAAHYMMQYPDVYGAEEMPNEEALDAGIEAGEEDVKLCSGREKEGCQNPKDMTVPWMGLCSSCYSIHQEGCAGCQRFEQSKKDNPNPPTDGWKKYQAECSLAAEFEDVIPSIKNVWNDGIPDDVGTETFVVEEPLKDYLIEEFYEDTFDGSFTVELHDEAMGLWEVTFPHFLSEDVIDSIAEYQTYEVDEDGFLVPTDAELADWVSAEEMEARGLVDSDDLFDNKPRISRSTAAIATAVIALSAAYLWSQRK